MFVDTTKLEAAIVSVSLHPNNTSYDDSLNKYDIGKFLASCSYDTANAFYAKVLAQANEPVLASMFYWLAIGSYPYPLPDSLLAFLDTSISTRTFTAAYVFISTAFPESKGDVEEFMGKVVTAGAKHLIVTLLEDKYLNTVFVYGNS